MILMDTCAIIWDALNPSELSKNALASIDEADARNALFIADISIWEIAMLIKKQRLDIDTSAADFITLFLQSRNVSVKPISAEIADLSVNFDGEINNDPADRLIAATSIIHNAQLVTADKNLRGASILSTIW